MYYRHGSYTHPAYSVTLSNYSKAYEYARGRKVRVRQQLSLSGFLAGDSQASIASKIALMESAYSLPANSSGLHHTAGQPSPHYLFAAGSHGGIQVKSLSYSPAINGEYATWRSFSISIEVIHPVSGADNLTSFSEQITTTGNGGPRTVVVPVISGKPKRFTTAEQTPVTVVQSGSAMGLTSYPAEPSPVYGSEQEHEDRRVITNTAPQNQSGIFTNYGVSWSYSFELLTSSGKANPNIR